MVRCALCLKVAEVGASGFFRVPSDKLRRERWFRQVGANFGPNAVVCQDHFLASDIFKAARRYRLMPGAVPTQKLPLLTTNRYRSPDKSTCIETTTSSDMTEKEEPDATASPEASLKPLTEHVSRSTQTKTWHLELSTDLEIAALKKELGALKKENEEYRLRESENSALLSTVRTMLSDSQIRKLTTQDKKAIPKGKGVNYPYPVSIKKASKRP